LKPNPQAIIKKHGTANSIKSTWDTEYREVFEYCMPSRDGFAKATAGEAIDKNFQDRRENLYTSVGEQSANDFVNTMQEVLAPPMSSWIALEAGMKIKKEDHDVVNKELAKMCDLANEYKNNSSFDVAFSEFCYDVFAGTGCMLVLPCTPRKPISFRAIPLREYCVEEGANGEVRGVYRSYSMKRELVREQWKELRGLEILDDEDKEMTLIESTHYDYDLELYHYQVIDKSEEVELVHREYQTNPFVVLRWNKMAGEPYGRGVGLTALNDIKTLNLIKFYSMRNFAYQLPILLAQESDVIDYENFDPTPLTLNIVPDAQNSIVPLNINPKYEAESYKTQELQMDIKRNTYSSTLPNEADAKLTATEVKARLNELRRTLNSVFGRLITEFQIPVVRRIFDILGDTGIMGKEFREKFDIGNIDGLIWKVNVVTPIGKIVRYEEAQTLLAVAGQMVQFDPTGQILRTVTKFNEYLYNYMKLSGVPLDLINTPKEMEEIQNREAQAQMQMQQQMVQQEADAQKDIDTNKGLMK
jgi:hypothetical protein